MNQVTIEVSARHCHLSQKDLGKLFGAGYQLKPLKPLSQKTQFAAKEAITIKTKAGIIKNLRIAGPVRGKTQVELSKTDAYHLKLNPPVRLSGNTKNSAAAILIGPKGSVTLREGVIIAKRHLHCSPELAKKIGLKNNQSVSVLVGGPRSIIFNNVITRIAKDFVHRVHIDTDEANAANVKNNQKGQLILK